MTIARLLSHLLETETWCLVKNRRRALSTKITQLSRRPRILVRKAKTLQLFPWINWPNLGTTNSFWNKIVGPATHFGLSLFGLPRRPPVSCLISDLACRDFTRMHNHLTSDGDFVITLPEKYSREQCEAACLKLPAQRYCQAYLLSHNDSCNLLGYKLQQSEANIHYRRICRKGIQGIFVVCKYGAKSRRLTIIHVRWGVLRVGGLQNQANALTSPNMGSSHCRFVWNICFPEISFGESPRHPPVPTTHPHQQPTCTNIWWLKMAADNSVNCFFSAKTPMAPEKSVSWHPHTSRSAQYFFTMS